MTKPDDQGSIADRLLDREAKTMKADFARKHAELLKNSKLFQTTVATLRNRGWTTHATLWNLCLYLNTAAHDLSILVEDLAFERDNWRRRLVARNLAVLAYESTEDMQALLGKTFRESLEKLGVLSRFETRLRDARKPLDAFWKEHQASLKQVRVTSVAHREHDGLAMLNTVESIDIDDSLSIGLALGKILNDLGAVLQAIINETSSIVPPEL